MPKTDVDEHIAWARDQWQEHGIAPLTDEQENVVSLFGRVSKAPQVADLAA